MKQQEIMDKLLREKLEGAEMEPPAALFEQISARLDRPALMPWYRKPSFLRAAAAVALLAVSTAVILNNWNSSPAQKSMAGLQSYDTLKQDQLQQQLKSMELAAVSATPQQEKVEKKETAVQPRSSTVRLASENLEVTPMPAQENIATMEFRQVHQLKSKTIQLKPQGKVDAPLMLAQDNEETSEYGLLPQITKSYSKLADGSLFELAKERIEDFRNKEHYLSFNLGSLEIGQTIQLSRPENNE